MEDLTSRLTFYYKFVFPVLWIGGFGVGTLSMFMVQDSSTGNGDVSDMRWIFLGVTVVGSAFIYWTCMRIKHVSLDGREFVISNYRRTIRVPLHEVERAASSLFMNPEQITLSFRRPSEFGSSVVFMPEQRFFRAFGRHPLAKRINDLIRSPEANA